MQHEKWNCPKCGHDQFDVGEFRATGGFLAKLFDVQNKRFTTASCSRCGYTEIYKAKSSALGDVFDLFLGR